LGSALKYLGVSNRISCTSQTLRPGRQEIPLVTTTPTSQKTSPMMIILRPFQKSLFFSARIFLQGEKRNSALLSTHTNTNQERGEERLEERGEEERRGEEKGREQKIIQSAECHPKKEELVWWGSSSGKSACLARFKP
jgi:hypothetical protein